MFWRKDLRKKRAHHHAMMRPFDLVGIYEDEIEKEDRRKYMVTLPHDYIDSNPVNILLSGTDDILEIARLPDGLEPGSSIHIIVGTNLEEWIVEKDQADELVESLAVSNLNFYVDLFWIVFCAALVGFSVSSFSVVSFADMTISDGCLVEDPNDSNLIIQKMNFLLFKGLCTPEKDFCILWTDYDVWKNIDAVIRSDEKMYLSAKIVWPVAQVLSVLTFFFLLCTLVCQILVLFKHQRVFTNSNQFYYIASCYALLAFVCSLVTCLEVEFAPMMKETLWETFFDRSTFAKAQNGDTTISSPIRTTLDNPCIVLTGYKTANEGMLYLVLTVPLSFLLFWWILGFKVIKPIEL